MKKDGRVPTGRCRGTAKGLWSTWHPLSTEKHVGALHSAVVSNIHIYIYRNKHQRIYTAVGTSAASICILVMNGATAVLGHLHRVSELNSQNNPANEVFSRQPLRVYNANFMLKTSKFPH